MSFLFVVGVVVIYGLNRFVTRPYTSNAAEEVAESQIKATIEKNKTQESSTKEQQANKQEEQETVIPPVESLIEEEENTAEEMDLDKESPFVKPEDKVTSLQATPVVEQGIEAKKADIERRMQEDLETTKNIGEDKLKEGRENTKKIVESLKQRYPATSIQGIIIRILEKLIDFNKYSTIIDSDYLSDSNASGQATWFGMIISQKTLDGILKGTASSTGTVNAGRIKF